MSQQPEPPASIYEAVEAQFSAHGVIRPRLAVHVAQAVWDALLAEGFTCWRSGANLAHEQAHLDPSARRVLVIPLPDPDAPSKEQA